jgi:hypothetical protein
MSAPHLLLFVSLHLQGNFSLKSGILRSDRLRSDELEHQAQGERRVA